MSTHPSRVDLLPSSGGGFPTPHPSPRLRGGVSRGKSEGALPEERSLNRQSDGDLVSWSPVGGEPASFHTHLLEIWPWGPLSLISIPLPPSNLQPLSVLLVCASTGISSAVTPTSYPPTRRTPRRAAATRQGPLRSRIQVVPARLKLPGSEAPGSRLRSWLGSDIVMTWTFFRPFFRTFFPLTPFSHFLSSPPIFLLPLAGLCLEGILLIV